VFNIKTMSARIEDSMSGERMVANLAGAFGALALALAAIGLYGILAYSVSRRIREIGIRMALGANSRSVLWMLSRETFALVAAGAACGIALAVAGSKALAQFMIGISPPDSSTAGACALVMFIVSSVAVAIPSVRGARTDPLIALRHD
jgi:ABC-type antimicrobial peptide transport system permease subunit